MKITHLRFEHHAEKDRLGTQEARPRLSWKFENVSDNFRQSRYEIACYNDCPSASAANHPFFSQAFESDQSHLVPLPLKESLRSRQCIYVRVRAWNSSGQQSEWSDPASIEGALMSREDWIAARISAPWNVDSSVPQPETLFKKNFNIIEGKIIAKARLYITAQGVYEAAINGQRVGDHFLAPGWTVYDRRLRYQTFDVLQHLSYKQSLNTIGVRVAEGWYCGRLGWGGGYRNIWGDKTALIAQLELVYTDGSLQTVATDSSWKVSHGPSTKAEIYDGEKYDARLEVDGWSSPPSEFGNAEKEAEIWSPAATNTDLPAEVKLVADETEPVRRVEVIAPVCKINSPSGKIILDFGQNLVGYTRIKHIQGARGTEISLSHAEVLEAGELGRRPLRGALNVDTYTLKGAPRGESWEPSFTFHGFRYVQVDGWPGDMRNTSEDIMANFEAVVCHTDMRRLGQFSCSDLELNKLHENIVWSMRGNFLSIPTDCPQRDERLGWTGDLAMFASTATLLYDCTSMVAEWLKNVFEEQCKHNGVPTLVVPNALERDPMFGHVLPAAIWSDVTILAPWALYQATGDVRVLEIQYQSMVNWMASIPKNSTGNMHLWDFTTPQLGDWLDPAAPPDNPAAGKTDAILVADAFLINSLTIMSQIARILHNETDSQAFNTEAQTARAEFAAEYISAHGRLVSDSQTAYALCLAFDLFPSAEQRNLASARLAFIVRRNGFKIGTGFAGTPYICEALVRAGHPQIAFSMLLNKECPSWLYPVSMGSTTVWERWDSMLPDGSINPGEMTSFNHYALGAVAKFMWTRLAGLEAASVGWKKIRVAPIIGGGLKTAQANIETPYGLASSSWTLIALQGDGEQQTATLQMEVRIPPNTTGEVFFPNSVLEQGREPVTVGSGLHVFKLAFKGYEWPIEALKLF